MKKLLIVATMLMLSIATYAQKDVTRFLGIPVDGSKEEMIQKLKAKGYKYDSFYDCLEGEFNGMDVRIRISTNNNKVWRVIVSETISATESQIKIRFNDLCRQFQNNKKYISLSDDIIPEDENISYEMLVKKKEYQSAYLQLSTAKDSNDGAPLGFDKNKVVWFTIIETQGKYRIAIFYENKYNEANGDDL